MSHAQETSRWAELLGLLLLLAFLLAGIGLLGWQIFTWLYSGTWVSVSLLDVLAWGDPENEWVRNPTDWIGLWKLLAAVPLSLIAIGLGCIGLLTASFERESS